MNEDEFDVEKLRFMKKYWKMTFAFLAIAVIAIVVAVLVLLWQVEIAVVPENLGQWSVATIIGFCLTIIFWELVLVGSWVAILAIVIYLQWYNKLPDEDKKKWEGRGTRENTDAIGFFIGVAWLIMLYVDGAAWTRTFNDWTFVDWIWSWIYAAFWVLLIAGIVVTVGLVAWVVSDKYKETAPEQE